MDRTPRHSVSHRQVKPAKPSRLVPILAGLCFLGAVAFAAYPAIRAGASSLGGILLLVGLAGVVSIGFFAFSGNPTASGQSDDTSEAELARLRRGGREVLTFSEMVDQCVVEREHADR